MTKTKKMTLLALTASLAIVLSFTESQIPAFIPIPGFKIGLANIVVIFTLYKLGIKEAICVSLVRVLTLFLIFGGITTLIYSISGAVISLILMALLKSFTPLTEIGVSVAGGVSHNLTQIAIAFFMLELSAIIFYIPILILSGTVFGAIIGSISALVVRKIKKI